MHLLKKMSSLVEQAENEFYEMLEMGHTMFQIMTEYIMKRKDENTMLNIKEMDKEMNKKHRDVRKKIYEHLTFTQGKDLFISLVLLSVVDDLERIGDYTKNILDTSNMLDHDLKFEKYDNLFKELWGKTDYFYKNTEKAFLDNDEKLAATIVEEYKDIAQLCEDSVYQILHEDKSKSIDKDIVILLIIIRHFKRVNAHLKNIASAVVNPFHRIGYKVKQKDMPG